MLHLLPDTARIWTITILSNCQNFNNYSHHIFSVNFLYNIFLLAVLQSACVNSLILPDFSMGFLYTCGIRCKMISMPVTCICKMYLTARDRQKTSMWNFQSCKGNLDSPNKIITSLMYMTKFPLTSIEL